MDSIFDTLKHMPLFAGLSDKNLLDIIGKNSFEFRKFNDGQTIIESGDNCSGLVAIVSGSVRVTITGHNGRISVSQTLCAPDVIAPEYFFGKVTHYPCQVKAIDYTGIMIIKKNNYIDMLNENVVCLFNYLNMLSANAQLSVEGVLALTSGDLERRIAYWMVALTQPGGKDIEMESRHRDLYTLFGVPRQSLIAALDSMAEKGVISYEPGRIYATDRKVLVELLERQI